MKSSELLKDVKNEIKSKSNIYYLGMDDNAALLHEMGYKMYVFDYNPNKWKNIRKRFKERPAGLFALYIGEETELNPKNPYKQLKNGWTFTNDNYPKYADMTVNINLKKPERLPRAKIDDVAMEAKGPNAFIIQTKKAEDIIIGAENTILVYKPKIWIKDFTTKKWFEDRNFKTEIRGDYLYVY